MGQESTEDVIKDGGYPSAMRDFRATLEVGRAGQRHHPLLGLHRNEIIGTESAGPVPDTASSAKRNLIRHWISLEPYTRS
jgi:hypothetical protein